VRWFATRLSRFTADQLRKFLAAAIGAASAPGITDALFEIYEQSRRVASAAAIVEGTVLPLLVRTAIGAPDGYAARIVANSPYSPQAIQLAGKYSSEWLAAIESAPSAARTLSLLAAGEVLGYGRVQPQRLGNALAKWISDSSVQRSTLRIAAAGAGDEVLVAILETLRQSPLTPALDPLASWFSEERVRNATRDVFLSSGDVAFYTRVLCARDRDRMHAFSAAISGAQQLDGKLTGERVDEAFGIVWNAAPLALDEAIRISETCESVLPATAFVQQLPALLLQHRNDPVAGDRLLQILETDKIKRALGERRRLVEVYSILRELGRPDADPAKPLAFAIKLLSRGDLPDAVANDLIRDTALWLASLRNISDHARLLQAAAGSPLLVDAYEHRAIERLRANAKVAVPSAAVFFIVWTLKPELQGLDRILAPELSRWSPKHLVSVGDIVAAEQPRMAERWQNWSQPYRSRSLFGRIGRSLFGSGRRGRRER